MNVKVSLKPQIIKWLIKNGGWVRKYIVGRPQKHLLVNEATFAVVKQMAKERKYTMVETTHMLLQAGIAAMLGVKLEPHEYYRR